MYTFSFSSKTETIAYCGKFKLAKLNPDKIFLKKKVMGKVYLNKIVRVRQDVMNFGSF